MNRSLFILILILILFVAFSSAFSSGDEGSTPDDSLYSLSLEELLEFEVSIASLFPEADLEAASTVAIITQNSFRERGSRRATEAISNQPGVMLLPNFLGGDSIAIRGFAQNLSSRGIATLMDGIPINAVIFNTGQYDTGVFNLGVLDSIEMIRGPGSAVHGSDAFHGVYALNSFRSDLSLSHYTAEYASNGYFQAALKFSEAMNDKWRLNLAVAANGQSDQNLLFYYVDVNGDGLLKAAPQQNRYNNQSVVLKLFSDQDLPRHYQWSFYAQHLKRDDYSGINNSFGNGGASDSPEDDLTDQDSSFYMSSFKIKQNFLSKMKLEASFYVWRNFLDSLQNGNGPNVVSLEDTFNETHLGSIVSLRQSNREWNTQWSISLGYRRQKIDEGFELITFDDGTSFKDVPPFNEFSRRTKSVSLSAKTSLFNDKFHLVYGWRLDNFSDSGTRKTPRLGLVINPTPNSAVKLLYGEAFRAESGSEREGYGTGLLGGGDDLQAETIRTNELVLMKYFKSWKAELNLFESRWSSGIVIGEPIEPTPGFSSQYINLAKNKSRGAEFSIQWRKNGWKLDGNVSHVFSYNEDSDETFDAFPRYIVNLGLGYQLPNGKTSIFLNNRIHYKVEEYPANQFRNDPDDFPHYFRADLNVNHTYSDRWDIYINVRNLFGRENRWPSIWRSEEGEPGEEFSVMLGVRYSGADR